MAQLPWLPVVGAPGGFNYCGHNCLIGLRETTVTTMSSLHRLLTWVANLRVLHTQHETGVRNSKYLPDGFLLDRWLVCLSQCWCTHKSVNCGLDLYDRCVWRQLLHCNIFSCPVTNILVLLLCTCTVPRSCTWLPAVPLELRVTYTDYNYYKRETKHVQCLCSKERIVSPDHSLHRLITHKQL